MNLNTTYLGLNLRSPLVVSALPLSESVDNIKKMEDAGAGAVVLFSLFEERMRLDQQRLHFHETHPRATEADAQVLFPQQRHFHVGLDEYLNHIRKASEAVDIPIIASVNCKSLSGGWTDFIPQIQQAGADALELDVYFIPTSMDSTSEHVEDVYLRILKVVRAAVTIPVAMKLTPYFTNLAKMARLLDAAGADGLVMFNRFFQPDFDPKTLRLHSGIPAGASHDTRLSLHWIAILYGYIKPDLAATGGIYTAEDVVKLLMVGAKVTMLASVLLKEGIGYLRSLEQELCAWLDQNDYDSVASLSGIASHFHSRDIGTFERNEYINAITSFRADYSQGADPVKKC